MDKIGGATMLKPPKLNRGDTIATISPAWGCAGDEEIRWKYELGVKRLEELGYRAAKGQPVDLFPRTAHVETVVRLERRPG